MLFVLMYMAVIFFWVKLTLNELSGTLKEVLVIPVMLLYQLPRLPLLTIAIHLLVMKLRTLAIQRGDGETMAEHMYLLDSFNCAISVIYDNHLPFRAIRDCSVKEANAFCLVTRPFISGGPF